MQTEKMEKTVIETVSKLEKLKIGDSLAAELSWCWNSYKYDQNPVGLIEPYPKPTLASSAGKEAPNLL